MRRSRGDEKNYQQKLTDLWQNLMHSKILWPLFNDELNASSGKSKERSSSKGRMVHDWGFLELRRFHKNEEDSLPEHGPGSGAFRIGSICGAQRSAYTKGR